MTTSLLNQGAPSSRISNRDMVEALRAALEKNHARVLNAASSEWESRFAGRDPSDDCVSLRVCASDEGALDGSTETRRAALRSYGQEAA
jgi:hypothetical protein